MPYMDGLQLASNIRKLNLDIKFKIVLISAEENQSNDINNIFDEI